ncbi:RxLR effector protein [Phytophthora megakarya]|uniref:RxLR effector protein n=1 Tax=Phytophthora megakarya TaxID=4795 RepID=A0A225WQ30_9STRA|nr:RxLR effector protein [Phytophthora megakarya]
MRATYILAAMIVVTHHASTASHTTMDNKLMIDSVDSSPIAGGGRQLDGANQYSEDNEEEGRLTRSLSTFGFGNWLQNQGIKWSSWQKAEKAASEIRRAVRLRENIKKSGHTL